MAETKITENTKGVFIISPTPFTDAGELDLDSTDTLVDFFVEKEVTGITIRSARRSAEARGDRVPCLHGARVQPGEWAKADRRRG